MIALKVLSVSTACWIVPRRAPALMARVSTGVTNIRLEAARMPALRDAASELAGMQGVVESTRLTTQEDDINEDDLCILTDLHMSSDYNSNSASQSLGAAMLSTFLRREAARIDASLAAEEALQVVEYGCATGGSSLVPLGAIQDSISNRPLRATMNDLPMNDSLGDPAQHGGARSAQRRLRVRADEHVLPGLGGGHRAPRLLMLRPALAVRRRPDDVAPRSAVG